MIIPYLPSRTSFEVLGDQVITIKWDERGRELWSYSENEAEDTADLDADGRIAFSDFLVLASNYLAFDASRDDGDLDGSTIVDFSDFLLLASQSGRSP